VVVEISTVWIRSVASLLIATMHVTGVGTVAGHDVIATSDEHVLGGGIGTTDRRI
jgi:hypothetical protein